MWTKMATLQMHLRTCQLSGYWRHCQCSTYFLHFLATLSTNFCSSSCVLATKSGTECSCQIFALQWTVSLSTWVYWSIPAVKCKSQERPVVVYPTNTGEILCELVSQKSSTMHQSWSDFCAIRASSRQVRATSSCCTTSRRLGRLRS